MGIGDWGLGIGDWGLGLGPIPYPQSPIPNPQSPIPIYFSIIILNYFYYKVSIKLIFIINIFQIIKLLS